MEQYREQFKASKETTTPSQTKSSGSIFDLDKDIQKPPEDSEKGLFDNVFGMFKSESNQVSVLKEAISEVQSKDLESSEKSSVEIEIEADVKATIAKTEDDIYDEVFIDEVN